MIRDPKLFKMSQFFWVSDSLQPDPVLLLSSICLARNMLYESFKIKGKNIIDEICMRTASGTPFWENLHLLCQILKSLFFHRFTHWNTSKIMYLSPLYPQEPSLNDPGQNLNRPFFRHFWQIFRSKWQSMVLLSDMFIS